MRQIGIAVSSAVFVIATVSMSSSLNAQAGFGSSGVAPVCLLREVSSERSYPVIVPAKDVEGMRAKGFMPQPCDEHFGSPQLRTSWRDKVCEWAAIQAPEFHDQFEFKWGERPSVLCGMAEVAVGQWRRGGQR